MKKHLFEIIIVIFMVVELVLIIFNFIDKCKISNRLEIDNMNDFSIQELKESLGYGSSKPIFIKFKISFDKYKEYNLQYEDASDDYIYEGEIINKKQKISDNYYMCYYESVIYDNKEKQEFKRMKNNRFFLKVNSTILIFLLFVYVVKKIINITNTKVNYTKDGGH